MLSRWSNKKRAALFGGRRAAAPTTFLGLFPTASATPLITEFGTRAGMVRTYCYTDAGADLESGSSQYFSKTSPTFTPTNKMTVRLSFKPESIGAVQRLVGMWDTDQRSWMVSVQPAGTLRMNVSTTLTDLATYFNCTATTLIAGSQYEIVVVYDGTLAAANRVAVYVNGVAEAGSVVGTLPTALLANTSALNIGGPGLSQYTDGIVQCVGISASALSGAALTAAHTPTFYDDQAAARQAEWMSFWNLCEASGAREDSKGVNGLTATGTPGVGVGPATGLVQDRAPCKQVTPVAGVEVAKPLLMATLANQPVWIDGADPYLDFDGTNDTLQTAAFAASVSQPDVIFIRAKLDAEAAARTLADGRTTATHLVYRAAGDQWSQYAGSAVVGSGINADTNAHEFSAKFDGATSKIRVDGVNGTEGDPGAVGLDGLSVMSRGDASEPVDGRLYHIAVVSGDLTDAQMILAEALL